MSDYDNYRFKPMTLVSYNCTAHGFPRLIKSELPRAFSCVKYDLGLNEIECFVLIEYEF